jgi:hypothetical protein
MGERAFYKNFTADLLITEQCILPIKVNGKSFPYLVRRISPNPAANKRNLGMLMALNDST